MIVLALLQAAEDFQLMTVNSSVKIKQSKTVVHHPSDIAQAVDDIQVSTLQKCVFQRFR